MIVLVVGGVGGDSGDGVEHGSLNDDAIVHAPASGSDRHQRIRGAYVVQGSGVRETVRATKLAGLQSTCLAIGLVPARACSLLLTANEQASRQASKQASNPVLRLMGEALSASWRIKRVAPIAGPQLGHVTGFTSCRGWQGRRDAQRGRERLRLHHRLRLRRRGHGRPVSLHSQSSAPDLSPNRQLKVLRIPKCL